jgi:hypothetical protein
MGIFTSGFAGDVTRLDSFSLNGSLEVGCLQPAILEERI